MISTKKILEGCLLAIARDANEKWNLYLEGAEYTEDDDPSFSKVEYSKLDYNEHLVPLYKFSISIVASLTLFKQIPLFSATIPPIL